MRTPALVRALTLLTACAFVLGTAGNADAKKKKKKKADQVEQTQEAPAGDDGLLEAIPAESSASSTEAAGATEAVGGESGSTAVTGTGDPAAGAPTDPAGGTAGDAEVLDATAVEDPAVDEPMEPAPSVTETEEVRAEEGTADEVFPVTGGLEFGLGIPEAFSKLGTAFRPVLEVGYLLPFFEQRLQAFVDFAYTDPQYINRDVPDPRVPGGAYRYRIIEREFQFSLGGLGRLNPPSSFWNVYGQLGLRLFFQKTEVQGNASGEKFLKNDETNTEAGLLVAVGGELRLGPGALCLELDITYAGLNHRVTGNVADGGVVFPQVGYHVLW